MHIHASQMNINPYSAAAEKAVAAQRAADVRKKLMKSAASLEAAASPEEARMIGQWLDAGQGQTKNEDECYAGVIDNKPAF